MRFSIALFIVAAAFAWLSVHGLLRLNATGATPPAIVLPRNTSPRSITPGRQRLAVPRKVERAQLRAFPAHDKQATRP
jgi:hypothetical protein